MLKLIKFDKEFTAQLNEMMDEWTAANEKIIELKNGIYGEAEHEEDIGICDKHIMCFFNGWLWLKNAK